MILFCFSLRRFTSSSCHSISQRATTRYMNRTYTEKLISNVGCFHHDSQKPAQTIVNKKNKIEKNGQHSAITLYQNNRPFFPQLLLTTTTVHTFYWMWYLVDFIPALSVQDPTVGYVGLTLATIMSFGATFYPPSLIQSIRLIGDEEGFKKKIEVNYVGIKTYTLPFVTPSDENIYNLGELHFDNPNDVTDILTKHGGSLKKFNGHLPFHAKDRRLNLLLHLTGEEHTEDYVENHELWIKYLSPSKAVVSAGGLLTKVKEKKEEMNSGRARSMRNSQRMKQKERLMKRIRS